MFEISEIGYMPGYSGSTKYNFTKKFPVKINVSYDDVRHDPNADYNVLVQCEPPKLYIDFAGMVANAHENFDLILAYDDRLLQYPQAREFCPVGAWVDDLEIKKTNQITYLMSSKILTHEHRMRFMIMRRVDKLTKIGDFDFLWHRSPPRVESKNPFFVNAKFHIACENQAMDNMFTEKLLDCFKTKTVPIYFGCTNIGKYFDTRGILEFNSIEKFEHIMNTLTPAKYDDLNEYVLMNYELSKPYWQKSIYQRLEEEIEKHLFVNLAQ